MSVFESIISFVAPHTCLQCGVEGALLCQRCMVSLPAIRPRCYRCAVPTPSFQTCGTCLPLAPLACVWAATPYGGTAKRLVHALKFERAGAAAGSIAAAISPYIPLDKPVILVPVPTANARIRQRGYDQAARIARCTARLTGQRYLSLLARHGSQRQVGKTRAVRQQQMASAFRVTAPLTVIGQDIILIDDVLTTGSTLAAAAQTLHAYGARSVRAAVFAAA